MTSDLLRHTLATLAYRAAKPLRNAPPEFATIRISPTSRRPVGILAHMADVMAWGASIARGQESWSETTVGTWDEEQRRFLQNIETFDRALAENDIDPALAARLFSGPIADCLTHTGQLALLRRVAESPIRGENYSKAEIQIGRVGLDQAQPNREFD